MRSIADLRLVQRRGVDFLLSHPRAAVWLRMGRGKTVTTLTAINLMQQLGLSQSALVVAPLRVCHTVWPYEVKEWEHLQRMRVSCVLGTPTQRMNALRTPADIYVVNYENLVWLAGVLHDNFIRRGIRPPLNTIVFDEIDKMKDSHAKRSRAFREVAELFDRRIGLTGTPSSEGLLDLHGQFRALDDGQRLGAGKTAFQQEYFFERGYDLIPFAHSAAEIQSKIADIVFCPARDEEDYQEKLVINDVRVHLDDTQRREYREFKRGFVLPTNGEPITAANAAVLSGKLLQWCGGAVYHNGDSGAYEVVHQRKLEALESIVSEVRTPILTGVWYRHEAERIRERFPKARLVSDYRDPVQLEQEWNADKIPMLIAHPDSIGHGMNLQKGSCTDLVWYTLPHSRAKYDQFNARLDRSGQQADAIMCHRLMTAMPIEAGVANGLEGKGSMQDELKRALEIELNHAEEAHHE